MKRLVCCVAFALSLGLLACGSNSTATTAAAKDSTGQDTSPDTLGDSAVSDVSQPIDTTQATDSTIDTSDIAVGPACGSTPVNDSGLGKPCSKPEDCYGQPAVTCIDSLGSGAPRFCVAILLWNAGRMWGRRRVRAARPQASLRVHARAVRRQVHHRNS